MKRAEESSVLVADFWRFLIQTCSYLKSITDKSYPSSSLITVLQTIPAVRQNGSASSRQPMRRRVSAVDRALCSGAVSKNSVSNIFNHRCQKQPWADAGLAHQQKGPCRFFSSVSSTPGKQMLAALLVEQC